MFFDASFMSYVTSKRRWVLGDIYNYEMNFSFISSSTFADSLQKVFKASTLNLITFINRHSSDCRTLSNIWGLCWICSKAVCIRTVSSSVVSVGVVYTTLFTCPQRKNLGVLSQVIMLAMQHVPISLSTAPHRCCSDVIIQPGWSAVGRHHAGTICPCISRGVHSPWAAEACSEGPQGKLLHSNGAAKWQVLADDQNSSPDVYRKPPLLVNSNEHCMRVPIIPDMAIPAVEVPVLR
jgi:hypothetical protein